VEASDSEEEAPPAKTTSPAKAQSSSPAKAAAGAGFKRMEIVEASDSEEEAPPPAKSSPAKSSSPAKAATPVTAASPTTSASSGAANGSSTSHLLSSRAALEEMKTKGNRAFAAKKFEESIECFTSCIESCERVGLDREGRSTLYSNRAFALLKVSRWQEASEDCSAALSQNAENVKALYRRAQARNELGEVEGGLADVSEVLKHFSAGSEQYKAAKELEATLQGKAKAAAPKAKAKSSSSPAGGFKRMEIVEASDSEEEAPAAKAPAPATVAAGAGFKRMEIVEASDSEEEAPPAKTTSPAKAQSSSPAKAAAGAGFKRMEIVEASDSEEEAPPPAKSSPAKSSSPAKAATPVTAASPTTSASSGAANGSSTSHLLSSRAALEEMKTKGNRAFAAKKFEESIECFTSCIESCERVGLDREGRSTLYSNRAFALLKVSRWQEASEDCSAALSQNAENVKALYRRAQARNELGEVEGGLADVSEVLKHFSAGSEQYKAAKELEATLQGKAKAAAPKAKAKSSSSPAGGFKRMEIAEASDSEDEKPAASAPEEAGAAAPLASAPANTEAPVTKKVHEPLPYSPPPPPAHSAGDEIERLKARGNEAFSAQDFEEAVACFSAGIILYSKYGMKDSKMLSVLHSNRALASMKTGDTRSAEADCSSALDANPNNLKALYRRAQARRSLGRAQDAMNDLDIVMHRVPIGSDQYKAAEALRKDLDESGTPRAEVDAVVLEAEEETAPVADNAPPQVGTVDCTAEAIEEAKAAGNRAFAQGETDIALAWYDAALCACQKMPSGSCSDVIATLQSNKAGAYVRTENWKEAEAAADAALTAKPSNMKALWRRAVARSELGQLDTALKDVAAVLEDYNTKNKESPEAEDLKARILAKIKVRQDQRRAELSTQHVRKVVRSRAPPVPTTPPKNGYEFQRILNSLKRHPEALTEYLKKSVAPTLLPSLFQKSAMETDILAQVVSCLHSNMGGALEPAACGEYLKFLLKTKLADIQFAMLSAEEATQVRDIAKKATADDASYTLLQKEVSSLKMP